MSLPRHWRLPTGNDYLSVPSLQALDFSAPDLNFISERYRGLIELLGGAKGEAFFAPLISLGGRALELDKERAAHVAREDDWTPSWRSERAGEWELRLRLVCPPSERGAFLDLRFKNLSAKKTVKVQLGAQGCFGGARLRINEPYELALWRRAEISGVLSAKHLLLSLGAAAPEFALALGSPDALDLMELEGAKGAPLTAAAGDAKALRWRLAKSADVAPGQELRVGITLGLGLDAVSAAATCVEFKRRGLGPLSTASSRWLQQRRRQSGDVDLDQRLNWNSFFNLFYATGVCLDSERFVCLTSRSPHYYVCGAYWDRDALLWSLPAVLKVDAGRARRMLEYALGVQGRNIGVHSRFLDGTVLEPGFELDELCAPVIALAAYVRATGDLGLLKDWGVRETLRRFERTLATRRHPSLALYDTLSGPDDDHEPQGYLTVDNALVWRALRDLADLKERQNRGNEAGPLREQAERVRQAVRQHLVADGPRGRQFVWSSDLRGQQRFYDSPAGSLQLLAHWGFCAADDAVLKATVAWLHSPAFPHSFAGQRYAELGCAHSDQPWTLSIANALLSGRHEEAKKLLLSLELDGGLACEAFDAKTGKPHSGEAFATAAGFLAYALQQAFVQRSTPIPMRAGGAPMRPQGPRPGQGAQPIRKPQAAPAPLQGRPSAAVAQGKPQPARDPQRGAIAPLRPGPVPGGAVTPKAVPSKFVGSKPGPGGKRSTKGVQALVKAEPLRPPKAKAKAAPAVKAKTKKSPIRLVKKKRR